MTTAQSPIEVLRAALERIASMPGIIAPSTARNALARAAALAAEVPTEPTTLCEKPWDDPCEKLKGHDGPCGNVHTAPSAAPTEGRGECGTCGGHGQGMCCPDCQGTGRAK